MKFEVGNVYVHESQPEIFLLAVQERLLVSWQNGDILEARPESKIGLIVQRGMSIAELCQAWAVHVCVIDAITELYIQPAQSRDQSPKQKRRCGGRGTAEEELIQQKIILRRRFLKG